MTKIEVIAKSGCSFNIQGKAITDKKYQEIEKTFGIRRLLKNGSLIEKTATTTATKTTRRGA